MVKFASALLVGALAFARVAAADDGDLLSSIYTENGYEVRRDDRVFTLFAALNSAGFTRAETSRELPFPRQTLHPIRDKLRVALLPLNDKLRGPVDVFLDTHPVALEQYIDGALRLGDAPEFKAGDGFPKALAGLDKTLAEYMKGAKGDKVLRALAADYRNELKRAGDALDAPLAKLRADFKLSEEDAPSLVLVPNPLDAPAAVYASMVGEEHVLVFGLPLPDRTFDVKPAVAAYAALLAREATAKVPAEALKESVDQLRAAGLLAAGTTPADLAAESLRAAVLAKQGKARDADVAAAFERGLVLVRDFSKALDEPPETYAAANGPFAVQVVAKADLKKATQELTKAKK